MREGFINKRFREPTLQMISDVNEIIREYMRQGYVLTIRQIHYQLVSRGIEYYQNTQRCYNRLVNTMTDARLAGLVDWEGIEDRTRNVKGLSHWDSPSSIVASCASQFRMNKWDEQDYYPEVWIEKEALAGVIQPVCNRNDVSYIACRGYMSISEMYAAANRFKRRVNRGQVPVVIHLGDHDPSGIDMSRDIQDRQETLRAFGIDFRRLALNMDQVEEYNPPPNFAKVTDSRFRGYEIQFGEKSWELDALDPPVIDALIQKTIDGLRDMERWTDVVEEEEQARDVLSLISDNWDDAVDLLRKHFG